MKKNQKIDYSKYKKFIIPLVLNLLTVFIIFGVIIPQINQIPETLNKIDDQNVENKTLNDSLSLVRSASDTEVDDAFETSVSALPTVKDAATIFNALSDAASASNTQLQDFSFDVGGIYGRAAGLTDTGVSSPSIEVTAQLSGPGSAALTQFGAELTKNLPLAEINNLSMNNDSATYQIRFFYKPLDTNKIQNIDEVKNMNQEQLNLLQQLKEWKQ